ncbi:STAS/SEC14 domain-containing protein [Sorangium sp. So ce1335]|uniref:STAS/SEC14 domain-containing protein n=1 Tax=Sorangium sp. So ce1335 TaxID=3133335 RepID=UPI003F5D89D5
MIEHEHRIGRHTVRVGEQDDTLDLILRGDVTPDDARHIFDFMESRFAGRSHVLVTGEMSGLGHVPSESRRVIMKEAGRAPPIRGLVYHRASFGAKVITELVMRAYALTTGADIPVHFAADEAEARAWLARRREQLAAAEQHRR